MSDLSWLSEVQVDRLRRFFPKSRGKPRVDDRRVLSGMIFFQRNRLMWKHAPRDYGPPKRLCCTNPVRDSSCESSVVAGVNEQTKHTDLQDHELARV